MNFSPFGLGVPLSSALPVATQFSAGKLTQNVTTPNGQVVGVLQGGENGIHYIRPLDAGTFVPTSTAATTQSPSQQPAQTLVTLPVTIPGAKPGDPQQTMQIQVLDSEPVYDVPPIFTYYVPQIPIQAFGQGATVLTVAYNPNQDGIPILQNLPYNTFNAQGSLGDVLNQSIRLDGQNGLPDGVTVVTAIQPQDIQLIQTEPDKCGKEGPPLTLIKTEMSKDDENQQVHQVQQQVQQQEQVASVAIPQQYLQSSQLQEYLQKMQQNTTLNLGLQQFLKFNNTDIKREQIGDEGVMEGVLSQDGDETHLIMNDVDGRMEVEDDPDDPEKGKKKKKYKKKPPKPKKPKPGQVHIATALDGTTLFCCPECHMAYPEKELLEQHLVGHKIERRFICDICGAGLKRKEHLERHKLGHNPERPFVCTVCMKGFKRKEHLNLHFVIHSGEKTEICTECGKGFYRKDHLRKHSRSHITRRAKEQAERAQLSKDGSGPSGCSSNTVTIQMPANQLQIPVQIQVPQHHIQVTANIDDENNQVSTVVLPQSSDVIPN